MLRSDDHMLNRTSVLGAAIMAAAAAGAFVLHDSPARAGQAETSIPEVATRALHQVTLSPDEESAVWSPDGESLVYTGGPWGSWHCSVTASLAKDSACS